MTYVKTNLIVVSEKAYPTQIIKVAKQTSHKNVCYVTFNKTYGSIMENLKNQKISLKNFKFIDAISRTIQDVTNTPECTYISSPEAITELAIVINTHLQYDFDYLIIDSVTNLITYSDQETVKKFIKTIIAKLDETPCKGIFFALDLPDHQGLIRSISTYVESVIKT